MCLITYVGYDFRNVCDVAYDIINIRNDDALIIDTSNTLAHSSPTYIFTNKSCFIFQSFPVFRQTLKYLQAQIMHGSLGILMLR